MAAVLDPQPIVAGLRGLFCRDAGREASWELSFMAAIPRGGGPGLQSGNGELPCPYGTSDSPAMGGLCRKNDRSVTQATHNQPIPWRYKVLRLRLFLTRRSALPAGR